MSNFFTPIDPFPKLMKQVDALERHMVQYYSDACASIQVGVPYNPRHVPVKQDAAMLLYVHRYTGMPKPQKQM